MKYRMMTWWWGKYVQLKYGKWRDEKGEVFPRLQVDLNDANWEEYNEKDHGIKNEYQNA